ncbi:MAG: hypothetical protein ACJ8AW_19165 [Rhodopila sp.]
MTHAHHPDTPSDTRPILGGDTAVTLTSAATLTSLGVSATPLGAATLDASGATPVADFPITGGTAGPGPDLVLLHQGSGLELADSAGTLDLSDFRIDTRNGVVDANASANGQSAGNVAVFSIGADGTTLSLTPAAAGFANQTLGTGAFSSDTVIGTAVPWPIIDPDALGTGPGQHMSFLSPEGTRPILGGDTAVTLTSAATLTSLGVSATPLGAATLDASGATPVADFPITGGTVGPGSDLVLLHQGSGLELADSAGTLDLSDFRIDTRNGAVDANVSVNGQSAGNVAVFSIGADGTTLSLTPAAAGVANQTLGTGAFSSDTVIGTAVPWPVALSACV